MKNKYLLTIRAEDRPGLLHLLTGHLNRKLIPIKSLMAAETDIHCIMLITMDISDKALTPLILKLENIIEVFAVIAVRAEVAMVIRSAMFKLSKSFLESAQAASLSKHCTKIVNINKEALTVVYSGTDVEVNRLYRAIDGPHLLGFSQTAMICDNELIAHEEQSSVIIRLAA